MENKWIAQSYIFADLLLKEILDQRCEPDSGFYLPGLAVANSELLQVLTPHLKDAHASEGLQSGWNELLRTMMSDDVYENGFRLQKLRWLYRLDGIWLLAVVLAFVHRSDPKYQKAVAVLQENAESRGVDFLL